MNEFCSKVFSGDVRASARLMRLVDDRAEGYEEYMKDMNVFQKKARDLKKIIL